MSGQKRILDIVFIVLALVFITAGIVFIQYESVRSHKDRETVQYNSRFIDYKQVLFLSSYSANYESYDSISSSIKEVFHKSDISFDVSFMDLRLYNTQEQKELLYNMLSYHLSNRNYDAVILGDDGAVSFALEYQDSLFKDMPLVFFGLSDLDLIGEIDSNPYITGTVQYYYIKDMIDCYEDLFGKKKKIVALLDTFYSGTGDLKQFYSLKDQYPDHDFDVINTSVLSTDQVKSKLLQLDSNCVFLVLSAFGDISTMTYSVSDIVDYVLNYVSIPVFSSLPSSIGTGFFGGRLFDYKEAGRRAAETVVSIINKGESTASMPIGYDIEGKWVFDSIEVKKYGLKISDLPENSIILNSEESFWEQNKAIFIPFLLIIIGFIFVIVLIVRHIVLLKKQRHDAEFHAKYDYLTKLPNRYYVTSYINRLLDSKTDFTMIMVDVDNFKNFNDYYSHACGDRVLCITGQRLRTLMDNDSFFCARIGGDEFLLIYKDDYLDEHSDVLMRLNMVLSNEIIFEEKKLHIQSSIGIVYSDVNFSSVDELVAAADFALYAAKKSGKNKMVFFDDTMKNQVVLNKNLTKKMECFITDGGFYLVYQPQINVLTGEIHGYEALLRLSGTSVLPSEFIPVAEEGGLISKIGRIVTRQAVEQLARWRDNGEELHQVAVNFSVGQMGDTEYPAYLANLLELYQIDPKFIEIEITESMLLSNSDFAMSIFGQLNSIGIRLALDDFGTGYSSLNYLYYLPVDTVKLDKSMIDIYLSNTEDEDNAFLKNVIRLVHSLGLKFTAEGVEQKWQVEKLKTYHVDYIQGYYYSRPVRGSDVSKIRVKKDA